jgi:hypothetical protein
VGDAPRLEQFEVVRDQVLGVADLDGIAEPVRERRQERVEPGQEVTGRGEGRLVEGAELENQRPEPIGVGAEPPDEELLEGAGVEEVAIALPGPGAPSIPGGRRGTGEGLAL